MHGLTLGLLLLPALAHAHGAGHAGAGAHDEDFYLRKLQRRHPGVNARALSPRQATPTPRRAAAATGGILAAGPAALLTQIGSTTFAEATSALPTTYAQGASVPIAGASPLPAAVIDPTQYPPLDKVLPPNSPMVQQWLSSVDLSGVPNIPPTNPGGCANASNAQAVANAAANGWWTCGGHTRSTDITTCPATNTWGSSYDDGPSPYTPKLLDYLDANQIKTTFFVVGSRAISRPQMLQYELMDGHQLSVHTWSHPPLTTLTNEQIVAELAWTKYAIHQITGLTPNTMRPPYGDIDDRVRYIALQMQMVPIIWSSYNGKTFDTQDWQIGGGLVNSTTVLLNFQSILTMASTIPTGFIVLAHDLYQQSVDLAVNFVLPYAKTITPALTLQPIITCLGKPMSEAYIETAKNSTPVASGGSFGAVAGSTGTGVIAAGSVPASGAAAAPAGATSSKKAAAGQLVLPSALLSVVGAFAALWA